MNLNKEKQLKKQGFEYLVGVDEVGRGAWAGPLVAAAVGIKELPKRQIREKLSGLKDSKKMTPQSRDLLFEQINQYFNWSIGLVTVKEINQVGIGRANILSLQRAVCNLTNKPRYVMVDYFDDIGLSVPTEGITQGDNKVFLIAAASVIAKVFRDRLMMSYHFLYPRYGFENHKGYGTSQHQQSLKKYGPCIEHRLNFKPVRSSKLEK